MDNKMQVILLVEDDVTIRRLIKYWLEAAHCVVHEAEDGESGLRLAQSLMPDVIVTDLAMPKMDGVQMIGAIRNNISERLKKTPIVVMTNTGVDSQTLAKSAGANVILSKPVSGKEMQRTVWSFTPKS